MKLLGALSCLLVAVAATPLFGTEQCAKGPEVWCSSLRAASQCGAVKHCQQTVWNRPIVKTVPCDLCKEVITIVGNFLKNNDTEGEILKYLNKVCEFIPDPSMVSECKEMVNEYYAIVINIIEQEMSNPSVICCALHLCSSLQQHLAGLKETQQLLSNEIPDIDLSKVVYPFMANIPLLIPQDKIQEGPKISGLEENLQQEYTLKRILQSVVMDNVDVCKDCLQLLEDLQEVLKTNSSFSKMMIENALKQCEQLGGGLSDTCKAMVQQYAELGLQMLIQMPAQQICCSAGLCAPGNAAPMLELTPAKVIVPAKKLQPAVKITKKPVGFDPPCELCEMVMEKLEKILESNCSQFLTETETVQRSQSRSFGHQERIKTALEKVCSVIPSKYCQQCKDFVEAYTTLIIDMLEQEVTPKDICTTLGLCSSRQHKMVKLTQEHIQSGGYCEGCKMMVAYMEKMLEKNCTEQNIKMALMRVCSFMPKSMVDECSAIVAAYEPLIIELLIQTLDPTFVCEKLDLCHNAQKPLLGSEKCMWGPSYWCKDMETAGSCNAIEHCKRHVWS